MATIEKSRTKGAKDKAPRKKAGKFKKVLRGAVKKLKAAGKKIDKDKLKEVAKKYAKPAAIGTGVVTAGVVAHKTGADKKAIEGAKKIFTSLKKKGVSDKVAKEKAIEFVMDLEKSRTIGAKDKQKRKKRSAAEKVAGQLEKKARRVFDERSGEVVDTAIDTASKKAKKFIGSKTIGSKTKDKDKKNFLVGADRATDAVRDLAAGKDKKKVAGKLSQDAALAAYDKLDKIAPPHGIGEKLSNKINRFFYARAAKKAGQEVVSDENLQKIADMANNTKQKIKDKIESVPADKRKDAVKKILTGLGIGAAAAIGGVVAHKTGFDKKAGSAVVAGAKKAGSAAADVAGKAKGSLKKLFSKKNPSAKESVQKATLILNFVKSGGSPEVAKSLMMSGGAKAAKRTMYAMERVS